MNALGGQTLLRRVGQNLRPGDVSRVRCAPLVVAIRQQEANDTTDHRGNSYCRPGVLPNVRIGQLPHVSGLFSRATLPISNLVCYFGFIHPSKITSF